MKIPFILKEYLAHPEWKVETVLKEPVTIVKTDLRCEDGNILCYYFDGKEEIAYVTTGSDLFLITPEPELTEFEKKLSDVVGYAISLSVAKPQKPTSGFVKGHAAELFTLARKEIMGGWSKGLRDTQDRSGKAYNDGYNLGFNIGYDNGKAEALKDLPRWRKAERDMRVVSRCIVECEGGIYLSNFIPNGSYCIPVQDLLKLPRFKED